MKACASLLVAGALTAGGCGGSSTPTATAPAPIVVVRPAHGERVSSTFHVSGTASVFDATLVVQTVRGGKTVERKTVTASEGAPARGTFDVTMHATAGGLVVRAFSPSAKDGSPQHEVRVHVVVTP
ncbi:MAG TPA: Gmad2 immunoglobulin-like domain-containing protein [Gaiellaceae bacterium]